MKVGLIPCLAIVILAAHLARAQDDVIDKELTRFAELLSKQVQKSGVKKVAVLDFTDLQGITFELGKFIAEQTTVNLVSGNGSFTVVDRNHLNQILAEHKLTISGLIQPENAKKFGQFSGADALILGTITVIKNTIYITAKITSTESSDILGAAKGQLTMTPEIEKLVRPPVETPKTNNIGNPETPKLTNSVPERKVPEGGRNVDDEKVKAVKTFGDLRIELRSLDIVNNGEFILRFSLANQNSKKSIWTALATRSKLETTLTDHEGFEFEGNSREVNGVAYTAFYDWGFSPATEIKPNGSVSGSVKFLSRQYRKAVPGVCRLQMQILAEACLPPARADAMSYNFESKIQAE